MNNEKLKKLGKENLIAAAFGIGTGAVGGYAKAGAHTSDTVMYIIMLAGLLATVPFVRKLPTFTMILSFFFIMLVGAAFSMPVYEALGLISRN